MDIIRFLYKNLILDCVTGVILTLPAAIHWELFLADLRTGRMVLRDLSPFLCYVAVAITVIASVGINHRQLRKKRPWPKAWLLTLVTVVCNLVIAVVLGIIFGYLHRGIRTP